MVRPNLCAAETLTECPSLDVMPLQKLELGGKQTRVGPVWPEWESRSFERHCRNRAVCDRMPEPSLEQPVLGPDGAFWCGPISWHFGHQLADFSMRILPSRFHDQNAKLLFAPEMRVPPRWFHGLLEWCEVPPEDVHFLYAPMRCTNLRVVPQAEQLYGVGPSARHLDAMDSFVGRKRLSLSMEDRPIFVSRAGLPAVRPRFLGEAYLEECIRAAGGVVFRPETASIQTQMEVYLSARTLIFSEGSALHLLQLLGRNLQRVVLLQRRATETSFDPLIVSRSQSFLRFPAVDRLIFGLTSVGTPARHLGISMPDIDGITQMLRGEGLDIAPHFSEASFMKAATVDLTGWVQVHTAKRDSPTWRESDRIIAEASRAVGFSDVADAVVKAMDQ